jgi:site-specific recombinase XerD
MQTVATAKQPGFPARNQSATEKATAFIRLAKAESTLRAYRADWHSFESWCRESGLSSLPAAPGTIALYLADSADRKAVATLQRRLAAISKAHAAAGFASPCKMEHAEVAEVWQGIRRSLGVAQTQKTPAVVEDIRAMVDVLLPGPIGVRDRALLLLGFAGAFRRSELVGLDVADLEFERGGIAVTIRRSKTDQEGAGRRVGIPFGSNPATCPVRAVQDWLALASISTGPLFRGVDRHRKIAAERLTDKSVALIVKRTAEAAGLDPANYAGHSLRSGLATSAARAGVSERVIARQTGHKSMAMLRRYIRDGELFRENAAGGVGL